MYKAIYRFYHPFHRGGNLEGIFTADISVVASILGKEIFFGEVHGKHSDVTVELTEHNFELITTDPDAVNMFDEYGLETGYNPFNYLDDIDDLVP